MRYLPTEGGNHEVVPESDVVWNCKVRQHPDLFRKVGSFLRTGTDRQAGGPLAHSPFPLVHICVLLMSTASIDELKCGGSIGRAETPRAASKVTVTPKPCFHFFPALLGSTRESMMSDGSLHEPQLAAVSWLSALVGADCSEPDYHYSLTRRAKRQVPSPATPPPSSWLSLPGLSPAAGGLSLSLSLSLFCRLAHLEER